MTRNQISKEQTAKINLFHFFEDPQFFSLFRHLNKCFSFLSGIFVERFGLEDNFCAKAHLGPRAHFLRLLIEYSPLGLCSLFMPVHFLGSLEFDICHISGILMLAT